MSQTRPLEYEPAMNAPGEPVRDPIYGGLPLTAWVKIVTVGLLFCAVFWNSNLRRLWEKTNPFYGEANWAHACGVPLIGLYYLYVNRDALRATKVRPGWFGLLIATGGLLLFAYGIWPGQNDFVKDVGMVITLYGVTALLIGWRAMRTASFPIIFLICAIPWPPLVYSKLAWPLQQLAANVAVFTLELTHVKAFVSGTKICIFGYDNVQRTLNVAEACAGLRSLMTFISIATAVAFLSSRPLLEKLVIVAMAIPIAIFCNVMRVAGQGLLDHYVSPQLSENFAHQFVGLLMMIPAFVLILLTGWVLDQIFVEETDEGRKMAERIVRRVQIDALPQHAAGGIVGSGPRNGVTPLSLNGTAPAAKPQRVLTEKRPSAPVPGTIKPPTIMPPPPSVRLASRPRLNLPRTAPDGPQSSSETPR